MSKILVVIDMQNDFITGSLGTAEAQKIVDKVADRIESFDGEVVFTMDTHASIYLSTREGKNLPVQHCIRGSEGWRLNKKIESLSEHRRIFEKPTFGSIELANYIVDGDYTEIELVGLCTDICVISNALLLKAYLPEAKISVNAACCAGVTPESHENALSAMKMCQIEII